MHPNRTVGPRFKYSEEGEFGNVFGGAAARRERGCASEDGIRRRPGSVPALSGRDRNQAVVLMPPVWALLVAVTLPAPLVLPPDAC
jgi:hypothetical protein